MTERSSPPPVPGNKSLESVVRGAVNSVLKMSTEQQQQKKPTVVEAVSGVAKALLREAVVLMPRTFMMKSEVQSPTTKEEHEKLYKSYVDSFNKISSKLDTVPRMDADNANNSDFRRLKVDEVHNFNAVKLHELYFTNSGDLNSIVRADSVPFMRLSRDWGTFDQWQLDFRACGQSAREGWAVCYFDPFKQQYFNTFIEGHSWNLPLMAVPVIVLDTYHHAWFYDYPGDKLEYLNKSMRELNWNVIELRMIAGEMAKLNQIYAIQPVFSSEKEAGVTLGGSTANPPLNVVGGGAQ